MAKTRVPALGAEGWFTEGAGGPALVGSRCTSCGTGAFPAVRFACRNPACAGAEFEPALLSRTGKVWSATDARYQPPPPFVPRGDDHVAFAIAAVELAAEQLVVLGQVAGDVTPDQLPAGTPVELVIDTLFEDDEREYTIWKWQVMSTARAEGGASDEAQAAETANAASARSRP